MSAHHQLKTMLDELMGTNRNGEEEKLPMNFDDPQVCKSFLLGCCPHEILRSTRISFLGKCRRVHSVALKADYELAIGQGKVFFYDLEALEQLTAFVAKADKKAKEARKRLHFEDEIASKVAELGEQIAVALGKAEQFAKDGQVDEGMKLVDEIDVLLKEKAEAQSEYNSAVPRGRSSNGKQLFRVCDVCSVFVGIHENEARLRNHVEGKLHQGCVKIRQTLKGLQRVAEQRRNLRREQIRREEKLQRRREQELREEEGLRRKSWRPWKRYAARRDEERDRSPRRSGGHHDHDRRHHSTSSRGSGQHTSRRSRS